VLTVGDLSRRTGIPIKAVREYTDHGLVNTMGRNPAGYRTYTSDALWCLKLITTLRGLGLTVAEIRGLTRPHPQPPGPRLAGLLAASRQRTTGRIAALQAPWPASTPTNATTTQSCPGSDRCGATTPHRDRKSLDPHPGGRP
jgi:DNA-binding transcriptional MerR regulator